MMQAAEYRLGRDLAHRRPFALSGHRRVAVETLVGPRFAVVADILAQDAEQMPFPKTVLKVFESLAVSETL